MYAEETAAIYAIVFCAVAVTVSVCIYMLLMLRAQRIISLSYKDRNNTDISFAELERQRIAADLHDELGSSLAAIKIHLECDDLSPERQQRQIQKTRNYIDEVMQKLREISNNLIPKTLQHENLCTAVNELCVFIGKTNAIEIRFSCSEQPDWLLKENEIHLYRIMQEILHNATRHGRPALIKVSLVAYDRKFVMEISDNGSGFDEKLLGHQKGEGIRNIIRRAHQLNGWVYLDTAPGKGTKYTIEIPARV